MKKSFLFVPAALLTAILLASCTKEQNKVFDTKFYTSDANTSISLYVDDVYKGQLSYFQTRPECGATPSDAQQPLNMQLNSGEYKITGKDANGSVVSNSIIRISASSMRTTGRLGGLSMENDGTCLTIGLSK